MNVTDVIDDVHTWAQGQFAADFTTVVKGMSTAELGRWRQTLPLLAVKPLSARDELVTLVLGGEGMRRLTVNVVFDVIDTSESECWRLGDLVVAALRDDPTWGGAVHAGDVTVDMDWIEELDLTAAQDPLPFLVWRVTASGLTFGA